MRLFAAAALPPLVVDHLASAVQPLRDGELPDSVLRAGELRWADPAGWHVTLAFYGELGEEKLAELTERIERAARRHTATEARVSGAGRFGSAVLWAGVSADRVVLRGLARSTVAAGRRAGVRQPERQRFRPHVTLARSRGAADLRPYVERLAAYTGPSWTIDEVTLLRSHPGEPGSGPRYEALRTFALTGVRARRRRPR